MKMLCKKFDSGYIWDQNHLYPLMIRSVFKYMKLKLLLDITSVLKNMGNDINPLKRIFISERYNLVPVLQLLLITPP